MGLTRPSDRLIAAGFLPDGTVEFTEPGAAEECVRLLREYDPDCSLVRNIAAGAWEVWRKCEDGVDRKIGSLVQERVPHGSILVAQLAAHDTRRGHDPMASVDKQNEALARERARVESDRHDELGDKLHHALSRDLSPHSPATRPIPLGDGKRG